MLHLKPTYLRIKLGGITDYEVKDNQLIVKVSAQISLASYIGEIVIVYEYGDNSFKPNQLN